ncbi:Uncharacterised protein [Mycobacterium tuberculosis]|nr:Uncharacterised protein [Mycobacterium tuberculosis]COW44784.1 Uncharacterised protein [Mycobacterium tuberculosis]COX11978.1 Uncharacterised protein [Mycobacterium tuberculosis]
MIAAVIRSIAVRPAGLRMSWSVSIITWVGSSWFGAKWRSAAR